MKTIKKIPLEEDFFGNLNNFLDHMDGLQKSLYISMLLTTKLYKNEIDVVNEFIKKRGKVVKKGNSKFFGLEPKYQTKYEKINNESKKSSVAVKLIPISLFVSLVSQFDFFISNLMKMVLLKYPLIISKDKCLNFDQVQSFSSIQKIKQYFINNEINKILRGNHAGHIDWFENNLGIKIKDSLGDQWGIFLELTERRNLFVHADGIVNDLYIDNCKQNKIKLNKEIKKDESLSVSIEYFKSTYRCLYEISMKLSWLVSEKIRLSGRDELGNFFNNKGVYLIKSKEYEIAEKMFEFTSKKSDEFGNILKNLFLINLSLVKKLSGNKKDSIKVLETRDWSDREKEFKLAVCVIKEEYKEAFKLMGEIGIKSEFLQKENYESDPLFEEFRKKPEFKKIFKKIYKENYISNKIPKKRVVTKGKKVN